MLGIDSTLCPTVIIVLVLSPYQPRVLNIYTSLWLVSSPLL